MISFRVSLEELDNLTVEADRRELSVSELLREAVEKLFGKPPSQGS